MEEILSTVTEKHFFISKASIKLIVRIILAIIGIRNVNLTHIAAVLEGEAKISSNYRKLQRFFANMNICQIALSKLMVQLSGLKTVAKWTLIMDRTNWKFGQKDINILMLSLEKSGCAVPILWSILDNDGGSSNTEQRIALVELFLKNFGADRVEKFLADREFIGDEWLQYLATKGIEFYIRIKSNLTIGRAEGELTTANFKINSLKNGESLVLNGDRYLGQNYKGPKVQIAALRNGSNELVIIATNGKPQIALEVYRERWAIETLFGSLKTRGFNFENTHMTASARVGTLLSLLAIAFTLCHVVGIWRHEIKPIKIKKHQRKATSFFRYGLDYFVKMLLNPLNLIKEITQIAYIFGCYKPYNQRC